MRITAVGWLLSSVGVLIVSCSVSEKRDRDDDDDGGSGGTPIIVLCEEQCVADQPAGEIDYRAVRSCLLCGACAVACENDHGGVCDDTATELGCSGQSSSCVQCINGECALKQNADTTFAGACATQATTCAMNTPCVTLNNCVAICVEGGVGGAGGSAGAGGAGGG